MTQYHRHDNRFSLSLKFLSQPFPLLPQEWLYNSFPSNVAGVSWNFASLLFYSFSYFYLVRPYFGNALKRKTQPYAALGRRCCRKARGSPRWSSRSFILDGRESSLSRSAGAGSLALISLICFAFWHVFWGVLSFGKFLTPAGRWDIPRKKRLCDNFARNG
jgi:hypothetical protein